MADTLEGVIMTGRIEVCGATAAAAASVASVATAPLAVEAWMSRGIEWLVVIELAENCNEDLSGNVDVDDDAMMYGTKA